MARLIFSGKASSRGRRSRPLCRRLDLALEHCWAVGYGVLGTMHDTVCDLHHAICKNQSSDLAMSVC